MTIKRIIICACLLVCIPVVWLAYLLYVQQAKKLAEKELIEAFVNLKDVPEPFASTLAKLKTQYDTGSYIAMSVFKPNEFSSLEHAKGRLFAIQHSPDDRVCPFRMAKDAEQQLTERGARVKFMEYPDGHGWRGNVYGRIRENLDWLQTNQP